MQKREQSKKKKMWLVKYSWDNSARDGKHWLITYLETSVYISTL